MTRVIATVTDAGRSCPYCRFPIKEGTPAKRCNSCDSLHHEDCWIDGGGCAVLGCTESASAATAAGAQGGRPRPAYRQNAPGAPTTQPHPGFGTSPDYPSPQPTPPVPQRSGNQTILAVAVLIALLGIGTGVAVATGVLSNNAQTNAPVTAAANAAAVTVPAAPSPSEQTNDRQAITGTLGVYESAYSDHNIPGLSRVFTPEISRHGLAAGGCTVARGRRAVLADYQSQFAEGSGTYELVGLSESPIQIDSRTRAHLDAHYRITPGGIGYVNFKFAELGKGWRISEVYATCE